MSSKPKVQLGLRLHPDLIARIDAVRGDVTRTRWVERALEERLERALGAAPEGVASESRPSRAKDSAAEARIDTDAPPASPRAPEPEPPAKGKPTAVQLAQRAGIPVTMARRLLDSPKGEWELYW